MMRPCPDIYKNQRPEMNNRKLIRENRPVSCFWQKIIHHSQIRSSQEKCDSIMAIPPLNQGILNSGINRIAFHKSNRKLNRINYVQHCNCYYSCYVKPYSNIHMLFSALNNSPEHVDSENYPH